MSNSVFSARSERNISLTMASVQPYMFEPESDPESETDRDGPDPPSQTRLALTFQM